MHSDYLNEDKICEMFQQEPQSSNKRQQISLNFTVTSRQSRCNQLPFVQKIQLQSHPPTPNPGSIHFALAELDKFNNWMQTHQKNSEKLIDDLSTLSSLAQHQKSISSIMPDHYPNQKQKPIKSRTHSQTVKPSQQLVACPQCQKNEQLIQIIQQEYKIKVQECRLYYERIEKLEEELQNQTKDIIKQKLFDGVQLNLLREEKDNLQAQVVCLRMEVDKSRLELEKSSNMEKSTNMQKSSSLLLKTKDLQKRLQPSTTTNSKLLSHLISHSHSQSISNSNSNLHLHLNSNAKYSTNSIVIDTMNRVQSLYCIFGDVENGHHGCQGCHGCSRTEGPTGMEFDDVVKFFVDQINGMSKRDGEQDRKRRGRDHRDSRDLREDTSKLLTLYKNILNKLLEVKSSRQKNSTISSSCLIPQPQTPSPHLQTIMTLQHRLLTLQKQILGLQNQKSNLLQTHNDIIHRLKQQQKKIKEYEQYIQKLRVQCRALHEAQKIESYMRKQIMFEFQDYKGNVRTWLRVRPRIGHQTKWKGVLGYVGEDAVLRDGKVWNYETVFGEKVTNSGVFNEIRPLVEYAYYKKNLCIIAYGQTGSGKTHTLHNPNHKSPGLTQTTISYLYQLIQKQKQQSNSAYPTEINLSMSMLQIHKQQIRDLLCYGNKVEIRENGENVILDGCKIIRFQNVEQIMEVYQDGIGNRMGEVGECIRSHFVVKIWIQKISRKSKQEKLSTITKISIVDLAGSEKPASNPLFIKQYQSTQKTFSTLATILSNISTKSKEREKHQNLPYRDTKLTHLLKQFLSPKANVVTFLNVSSSQYSNIETGYTLAYGQKIRGKDAKDLRDFKENKETKEKKDGRDASSGVVYKEKDRENRELRQMKQKVEIRDYKEKQYKQAQKNRRSSARLSIG